MVKVKEFGRDIRDIALIHYKNGKKTKDIVDCLANKCHERTIYRWINEFRKNGMHSDLSIRYIHLYF